MWRFVKSLSLAQITTGYAATGIATDFVGFDIATFSLAEHNSNNQNRRIRWKSDQHGYGEWQWSGWPGQLGIVAKFECIVSFFESINYFAWFKNHVEQHVLIPYVRELSAPNFLPMFNFVFSYFLNQFWRSDK